MSIQSDIMDEELEIKDRKIKRLEAKLKKVEVERDWNKAELERVAEKALEYNSKLKKAVVVLEMVEDNRKMPHKHLDYFERLCCLTERAAEVLSIIKAGLK